ncbi:MAG: glycosyltransferase family 2 protein [Elusimicrobia bacterium]|nr:glycosyltransferase family 2 protein [Candidatus Obscuribacterium magneticum]
MSDFISVVLPAYNEADCVLSTIDDVEKAMKAAQLPFEIIVVDDGSTDRTAELAAERNVRLIRHKRNLGVGAARKKGILEAKGNIVVTTDVDGTYPIDQIPSLYREFVNNNCDMVVGARTGRKVAFEWPHRSIPKLFIRWLASYLSRHKIPDLNSGLRLFRREIALRYFYLLPDSHSWESTITLAFLCNHHDVLFFPINYFKRKGGASTFAPFRDTYNYISLVIRTIVYFSPLRVFIPLSLMIILGGGVKIVYDWVVYQRIGSLDVIIFLGGILVILVGLLADLIVVVGRRQEYAHLK